MKDDDSIRFKNSMATLGIAFSKAIASPLITVYWKGLRGVGIDLFETACEKIVTEDRSFPRVSRILEIVDDLQATRARKRLLTAGEEHSTSDFHCDDCRDSGLKAGTCTPDRLCKWCRAGKTHPDRWMTDCHCKSDHSNPNFNAHIQTARANVAKPERSYSRKYYD
jgi:hypothetical protein